MPPSTGRQKSTDTTPWIVNAVESEIMIQRGVLRWSGGGVWVLA